LAWLVRRCDENDSSGAWRRWPSDVCWLPTAFVAWRFSYTVENKVLICNLVILSTRKTQQDEDESESETSHKPNGMWVHQKQIEKIKGESRKKTRSACAADTGAVLHKSKCRASVKRKLTQRDREMLHSYAYIIPYSSASERGPW
jgi:hypothetical protein